MSANNNGGPAFPIHHSTIHNGKQITFPSEGMSLRDWFAGQALAGLMAHPTAEFTAKGGAAIAYEFADAMIRAREGGVR